jgi:REP element-mobilizing transposase RayT
MKIKQLAFPKFKEKKRKTCGRKRLHSPGVAHSTRERVTRHLPLHINFKLALEKGTLRNKTVLKFLAKAIAKARAKDLRIIQFSLQHNHVHLIVEANNNQTLSKGMRALIISLVMRLNFHWKKSGQRLKQRYHLHVLRTRREVQHACHYVRHNVIKHSGILSSACDAYSSFGTSFFAAEIAGRLDPPRAWLLKQTHSLQTT